MVPGLRASIMSSVASTKRKNESVHRSVRVANMAKAGVFMETTCTLPQASKDFCRSLLYGNQIPQFLPSYTSGDLDLVLKRVRGTNETCLQRDVTPWIVPSAGDLNFSNELNIDYLCDEIDARWSKCEAMGSTQPKPDYACGLKPQVFTREEMHKLRDYASPKRPVFFMSELCFPFLVCEVKSGEGSLEAAGRQNIHSASVAVRSIIELHRAAYGERQASYLYGKILAFSISRDNEVVNIYGHYAEIIDKQTGELGFHRYNFASISLTMHDGRDRFRSYNFVLNLYREFAPKHLKRIRAAVAALPSSARQ